VAGYVFDCYSVYFRHGGQLLTTSKSLIIYKCISLKSYRINMDLLCLQLSIMIFILVSNILNYQMIMVINFNIK
jgi:hypothetical protein